MQCADGYRHKEEQFNNRTKFYCLGKLQNFHTYPIALLCFLITHQQVFMKLGQENNWFSFQINFCSLFFTMQITDIIFMIKRK